MRLKRLEAEYRGIQDSYLQYLAEVRERGFENVAPLRKGFLTDPMTFGYRLRQRPLLMINALWDEAIPREAALDLWKESGEPPTTWYPTTHSSLWLWYPSIAKKITYFLRAAFGTR